MPLLVLIAATSIACLNPAHRDGQSIRCGEKSPVYQLDGITAPPVLAACTGGLVCPDDPGIMARDHLADLTRGQPLVCTLVPGKQKTQKAQCMMGGINLSCAMVADGMATADAALKCPPAPPRARFDRRMGDFIGLPPLWRWIPLYFIFVNVITYAAVGLDHHRFTRAMTRVAPAHLLTLTFFGGGLGGMIALWRYGHLGDEQPFANQFAVLVGLQIGTIAGLVLF